jgi:hypothetical protein
LTTTEAGALIYGAAGVYRACCVARPAVGAVVVAPGTAVVVRRPVVVAPLRRSVY